jgi:hypothetical protein
LLQPGEKTQRVVTVLVTWGVLLAVFGLYEWSFVRAQKEFLEKESFRTLAAVAKGLNAKVDKAQKSAASFLKLVAKAESAPRLYSYLDSYLDIKDKTTADKAVGAANECASADDQPLESVLNPDRLTVSIYCSADHKAHQPNSVSDRNATSKASGPKASAISIQKPQTDPSNRVEIVSYDITPNPPTFSGLDEQGDIFDDVLIAEPTGRVLFQNSQTGPRIANLKSFVGAADAQKSAATQKPEPDNSSSDGQSSSLGGGALQRLAQASTVTDITLADVPYKLFSQPVHLPLRSHSNAGKTTDLLVCAIVNARRFDRESHAVPYSIVIWAAMIGVLLFSLSWPLFKLRYMSDTERFSVKDGWYLLLAIFLVSTSGTLMLINLSYTVAARHSEDQTLEQLADQIKHHFDIEMMETLAQLQQLRPVAVKLAPSSAEPKLFPNYLVNKEAQPTCYPFFEAAFWTDEAGQEILRFDVRGASTPAISVSSFPFFQAVMKAGKLTTQPSSDSGGTVPCPTPTPDLSENIEKFEDIFNLNHAYVHPVLSPNTDEFSVVLADASPETTGIEAIATKPMSLVDPVLPPGYGFALIDGACTVLFHSQSFRNMRENFCQESKDSYEVKPVLLSGVDTNMDVSYLGQTERAYVTEITSPHFAAGAAFLIVFRQPGVQLTLNLAIILVCSILLGAYFAVLVLVAIVHLLLRRPLGLTYPPEFIWPQQRKAWSYLELFVANSMMLIGFWYFYRNLFEVPLLAMTLSVPAFSVLFLLLKLSSSKEKLSPIGAVLFGAGFALAVLGVAARRLGSDMPALVDWGWLLLLVGALAVFLSGRLPWGRRPLLQAGETPIRPEQSPAWLEAMPAWLKQASRKERPWLEEIREKHYGVAYTLMCVTLIAAAVVAPCLGFFKCAYDAVMELSLKHDQLVLSESLSARRDRIRAYYANINVPEGLVQARLDRVLDLYQITYYEMIQLPEGPSPRFTVCWDCSVPQAEKQPLSNWIEHFNDWSERLNDLLEKRTAYVTLNFPSNRLGSEMSKLGLASTDDNRAWEHFWGEPKPWQFRLNWKPESRMRNLRIVSEYVQWPGLQWWACLGLDLLWALLAAWVMALTRQIFFIGVESAPPFEEVSWKAAADIKMNYLLIAHAKSGKSEWIESVLADGNFSWLDGRSELKKMVEDPTYKTLPQKGDVVVLDHFDYNLWDSQYNEKRLQLLEGLVYETSANCRLVVASTVDPLYFFTQGAPDVFSKEPDGADPRRLLDRWARALSKFKRGRPKEPMTGVFIKRFVDFIDAHPEQRSGEFVIWVCAECNCTAMLRKIGIDLFDEFRENEQTSREGVVSTVLDRADAYYHVLWTSLTFAERLVLYQLALDGWTNAKNSGAIQQLERKQLIYKGPMYRIMNESFRRFIESTEHENEILQWQKQEKASTWHAFRTVLIVAVVGVAVWMLYTQAALSQTVIGVIAGSATLLTAIGGLLGRFKTSKAAGGS